MLLVSLIVQCRLFLAVRLSWPLSSDSDSSLLELLLLLSELVSLAWPEPRLMSTLSENSGH